MKTESLFSLTFHVIIERSCRICNLWQTFTYLKASLCNSWPTIVDSLISHLISDLDDDRLNVPNDKWLIPRPWGWCIKKSNYMIIILKEKHMLASYTLSDCIKKSTRSRWRTIRKIRILQRDIWIRICHLYVSIFCEARSFSNRRSSAAIKFWWDVL